MGVQCYELFGGITLKITHYFFFLCSVNLLTLSRDSQDKHITINYIITFVSLIVLLTVYLYIIQYGSYWSCGLTVGFWRLPNPAISMLCP